MLRFGLVGRGISYSLSPQLHNEAFRREGIEAEYGLCDIPDLGSFGELMKGLDGANVTIPYKQEVIPFLDRLTQRASVIGAVNTIYKRDGLLIGDNTDCDGFMALFDKARDGLREEDRIAVLGNGGAAKAIKYVLDNLGFRYDTVTHKEMDDGMVDISGYKMVINATPNHHPNVSYDGFSEGKCAIDLTYNPEETEFLRETRIRGARVYNGMTMLVKQAECARRLWKINNQTNQ